MAQNGNGERRARIERKLEERRARPPSDPPTTDFDEEEVTDVLDIALGKLEKATEEGGKAKREALAECERISQTRK